MCWPEQRGSRQQVTPCHTVSRDQDLKISKHIDQIPHASMKTGLGKGKCRVPWCFQRPNQCACEGPQLIWSSKQFWKTPSLSSGMEKGMLATKGEIMNFTYWNFCFLCNGRNALLLEEVQTFLYFYFLEYYYNVDEKWKNEKIAHWKCT